MAGFGIKWNGTSILAQNFQRQKQGESRQKKVGFWPTIAGKLSDGGKDCGIAVVGDGSGNGVVAKGF